jgi:integrase
VLCFVTDLGLQNKIGVEVREAGLDDSSFPALADKMADYLLKSKADSTNRKYHSSFKKWENFIVSKGGSALPASPIHVALYVTNLLDNGCSDSTVLSSVYGIKWAHKLNNMPDPTENGYVTNLMEAAKRIAHKPIKKKEPITSDIIISLCDTYSAETDILIVRDLCMIVLCYSGFLRFDEVSNLRCNDIAFFAEHFSIQIRKSKTDVYRSGKEIVINKGSTSACPYNVLKRYLHISGQTTDSDHFLFRAVFRSKGRCGLIYKQKPLSYTRSRECILARLKPFCEGMDIGLHSLRAGGATAAANAGVNDRCWKRHGRWKSDSSKDGYVADSLSSRLEVSKHLHL